MSMISLKYGFKYTLGITATIGAFVTFLYPVVVRYSFKGGVAMRIVLGALHSGWFPALQGAWGVWAPTEEKSKLITTHFMGAGLGNVCANAVGGLLITRFGWESIFYVPG